ncbi:DUF418 domain-containing protein [Olivibacter sp. CPCC 100613]|uniref:DUF418 domain-containing protein n=1 Tax=Olivibacter sp. CPCC 100613 TaxID=3079931 RepID=UPI002FF48E45
MHENISTKIPRIEVVDALRGFAVMAILLVHNLEHFIFPVYPDSTNYPHWLSILDQGVFDITFSLFAGKSYAIFALLFGFTFHIQYTNQQIKGNDFGYRFLWRLLLLVGFAALNAAFFPAGDVLLLFSIVGILLFIVRNWSDQAILIAAVILLLQPVEWVHYILKLMDSSYTLPDLGVGAMYKMVAAYTSEGDFSKFILGNLTLGQKASLLWAVGAGRFLQTAGLFLLGLLIGRKQLFLFSPRSIRFWTFTLIFASILYGPLYVLKVNIYDQGSTEFIKRTIGVVFDMWQKLAFTFVLVSAFVLLYQTAKFKRLTSKFRYYGKMSLTNYIMQSIVGAFLYFPFGLYLAPHCGYTLSLCIGIIVFFLQVLCCKWWLKRYKQGPLESLWHKLTWIR